MESCFLKLVAMGDNVDGGCAASDRTPSLEAVLMRQHGIRYGDAKRLVLQSRQTLQMARDALWNPELKRECECQLQGHPEQYPAILTPDMVRTGSVRRIQSETKVPTAILSALGDLSTDVEDEGAQEGTKVLDSDELDPSPALSNRLCDTGLDNGTKVALKTKVASGSNSSVTVLLEPEIGMDNYQDGPKAEIRLDKHQDHAPGIIAITLESGDCTDYTEEETDSQRDEEDFKLFEVIDSNNSQSQVDGIETEPQEEWEHVADGGENAVWFAADGIKLSCHCAPKRCCEPKEPEHAMDHDHCDCAEDGAKGNAEICSLATNNSNSIATNEELKGDCLVVEEINTDKKDDHGTDMDAVKRTDEISVDTTAMMSIDTIPCIIYIKGGPPEVSDDESLDPRYSLPTYAKIQSNQKHGIGHSLRHRIGSRIGIFRRQTADRLSDNDSEAHRQTLVDL